MPHLAGNPLRVWLYFMAALSVVLVAGCGPSPDSSPAPLPTPTAISVAAPTAAPAASSTDRSMAPNFSLPSAGGNEVSLSGLLEDHKAVVLVFYRGYF